MMILSGDRPRSRILSVILIAIFLALAFAPFLFPGSKPLNVAAKICIFALLVASYDLLLGFTGIVSFAHTMFFGIGSYGVALAIFNYGPTWSMIALGTIKQGARDLPVFGRSGKNVPNQQENSDHAEQISNQRRNRTTNSRLPHPAGNDEWEHQDVRERQPDRPELQRARRL